MKKYMKEIILLIVCIAVFAGAICALIGIWNIYHKGQAEYEDLKGFARDPDGETETDSDSEDGHEMIDFGGLKALNPDIVAWIRCEELGIDYPVVQGADNDYYLHRTFTGEDHIAGCIFMDCRNSADFSDQRTILYGHNMKDGSMFGRLNSEIDITGKEVLVFLPEQTIYYTVISSNYVPADDVRYCLENLDMQRDKELMLSTCSNDVTVRFVVTCQQQRQNDS